MDCFLVRLSRRSRRLAQVHYCDHALSVVCRPSSVVVNFSHSPLKPLKGIQRNLTGRKISMCSTKFVFFGPIRKTTWPSWPLIGWDIFNFSSETVERNSTKLDRKQDLIFSLLRQGYPPILTSGEMLSHPGGWDKPIPEVIYLWRHRTSTPNNREKSRLVCVIDIFYTFLYKNEKNNQSPHRGRDEGIPSSCPRFSTFTTKQASSWIANLGHSDGIHSSLPQCCVRFY